MWARSDRPVVRSRIGLMVVAVAKALGAQPGILTEMGDDCMKIACPLGADYAVKINKEHRVLLG
jgi:threonine dehydrogenase-like Zn-dependent dehydrogenase